MQATNWDLVIIREDDNNWYTNCVGGCGQEFASSKIKRIPVGNPLNGITKQVAGEPTSMMCMSCHLERIS